MAGNEIAQRFGANFARARERAGISQEEVGFRASLHRTEVGQLERGVRLARIDTLVKLAGALGVPPGSLLDGMAWERANSRPVRSGCHPPTSRRHDAIASALDETKAKSGKGKGK